MNNETNYRTAVHTMTEITSKTLLEQLAALEKRYAEHQQAMGAAVEKGDEYHDNFAYEQATRERDMTYSQLLQLKEKLQNIEIVKPRSETDTIGVGNEIAIQFDGEKETVNYTLLGSEDGNVREGWISNGSPLGAALFGKRVGETVAFAAGEGGKFTQKVAIKSIRPGSF